MKNYDDVEHVAKVMLEALNALKENEKLREKVAAMEEQNTATDEAKDTNEELIKLREERDNLRSELVDTKKKFEDMEKKFEAEQKILTEELSKANQKIFDLEKIHSVVPENFINENRKTTVEVENVPAHHEETKGKNIQRVDFDYGDNLTDGLDNLIYEYDGLIADMEKKFAAEHDKLKATINALTEERDRVYMELSGANKRINDMEEKFSTEHDRLHDELSAANKRISDMKANFSDERSNLIAKFENLISGMKKTFSVERKELNGTITNLTTESTNLNKELSMAKQNIVDLKKKFFTEINELSGTINNLTGERDKLRGELSECQKTNCCGCNTSDTNKPNGEMPKH